LTGHVDRLTDGHTYRHDIW